MPLAALVLAAGLGTRLRPLTDLRPKALCPVGNVPLVDRAIARARAVTGDIAVNVHAGRAQMEAHLQAAGVHLSVEPELLGTAGAVGALLGWIAGRDLLVLNGDAWHDEPVATLAVGWDGRTARLMTVTDPDRGDFGARRYCGAALLPNAAIAGLRPAFSGLFDLVFAPMRERGLMELAESGAAFFDCGTPRDYHAANMAASGGANVVGEGAVVEGRIERTVVWPGAYVAKNEHLVSAVRAGRDVTVYA